MLHDVTLRHVAANAIASSRRCAMTQKTANDLATNVAQAALALHRFGLGPRPGSIAAIASDPRGALLAELETPGIGRIHDPGLLTSAQAARMAFEARAERQANKIVAEQAKKQAELARQGMSDTAEGMAKEMAKNLAKPADADTPAPPSPSAPSPTPERLNFLKEVKARLDAALDAEIGFAERLVWFWSNHFCVSTSRVFNQA